MRIQRSLLAFASRRRLPVSCKAACLHTATAARSKVRVLIMLMNTCIVLYVAIENYNYVIQVSNQEWTLKLNTGAEMPAFGLG